MLTKFTTSTRNSKGTYLKLMNCTGGQTIQFSRGLDAVTLTITDEASGQVTTIVVPTFVAIK